MVIYINRKCQSEDCGYDDWDKETTNFDECPACGRDRRPFGGE